MKCSSCSKLRSELHLKKSRLNKDIELYLCQSCIDKKLEPRWLIVLHGRKNGLASIRDFISPKRYLGDEISAKDLV